MPASNQGIIDNINCKLTTGGLTDQQAAQLAGAAQALCCSTTLIVPSCACLPTASLNKGRFVYVQDLSDYRYSNGAIWTNNYCTVQSPNLYTWGLNNLGQLGDGTATSRSSPGTVAGGGTNWCAASAGTAHTAAVKTDGTLWTWGCNGSGQLGDGTATTRSSPGTVAGGGTTWCAASAGYRHTAAVKTDGTLWTWGCNGYGRLGDGTATNRSSPVTVAGGGTTWCAASAGTAHTVAVKTDGTLWTWGCNGSGRLGDGTATNRSSPGTVAGGGTNWCSVTAGQLSSIAVKTDGTLWTWGNNGQGRLGDGTTTNRSSPGTVAGGGTTWCAASAGNEHTAAVKTDGTLWTWGCNGSGRLGDGTTTSRSSPVTVAGGGTTWCAASAGNEHTAAVKTDGTLWTWGSNSFGGLGDGTATNRSSPGTVAGGGTTWCAVSAGGAHTAAVQVKPSGF
jgi:alpha-tubulin suppressor-like RCC1 family protein